MNELERNCYNFLIELSKELAADFETQFLEMDDFARWNLPEEIALEWIDSEGMLQILKDGHCGLEDKMLIWEQIICNFNAAYDQQQSSVWTFRAMQEDIFWIKQRKLAQKALNFPD